MEIMFINLCLWMNNFILLLLLFLLTDGEVSSATQFTHDRKRIGDPDLAMAEEECLRKFTINENTIIRTQDSRILGAKFLNESDIGNREDCLIFCCSTRFCNVAVFQEKSPFSCYLFDCGPTDNFLCKFTGHSSYTSAVLAVNRRQLDLGVWSSQFQHEAELNNLRFSSEPRKASNSPSREQKDSLRADSTTSSKITASFVTTPETEAAVKSAFTSSTLKASSQNENEKGRKCSNFQFECHSGECIAIYNACDGIPQCADGSDEGKELACPQRDVSAVPASEAEPVKMHGRSQSNDQVWNGQAAQSSQRRKWADKGIFNHHRSNLLEYNHNSNDQSLDYGREESVGYGDHGKGPGFYDYPQGRSSSAYNTGHHEGMKVEPPQLYHHDYLDYGLLNQQHELPQIPSQRSRQQIYPVKNNQQFQNQQRNEAPHIDHQLNSVTGQNYQEPNPQYAPYQLPQHVPHIQHYEDTLRETPQMSFNAGLDVSQQDAVNSRSQNSQLDQPVKYGPASNMFENNLPKEVLANPNNLPTNPQQFHHENNKNGVGTSSTTSDSNVRNSNFSKLSNSKGSDSQVIFNEKLPSNSSGSQTAENRSKQASEKPSEGEGTRSGVKAITEPPQPVVAHASLSRLTVNVDELEREEDNQRSQTSGAILALSLGMSVTIVLIVLVGCRIRKVKRRVRRRRGGLRSPLEHDVDYLVNGMYL